MSLITLGLNHTTAPVSIRERLVFPSEQLQQALRELVGISGINEAAILSTCNRTEVYCDINIENEESEVLQWLGDYHHFKPEDIKPFLYRHLDKSAVRHALRVACGLDSMVLGEPQILGQLKSAYQSADDAGTLGHQLGRLFQHAFSVAKQVRTDTAIGASPVSVAFAAVRLAQQIFSDLGKQTALLIGAGETIELAARHLAGNGIGNIIVANRHVARAQDLAEQYGGRGISLPEISKMLTQADIIISSTASPLPILGKGMVESALKQRKHRPIFMVDIAVPRDIEPEVNDLRDVYLYTVDDLQQVIEDNLESRREAANEAHDIIDVQVEHFMAWLRSQDAVGTIRAGKGAAYANARQIN